jgi:hypothetical protein
MRRTLDTRATANLRLVEGAYRLGEGKTYHPLVTVLVGLAASDDWLKDVATTLGVDEPWVRGFPMASPKGRSPRPTPSTFRAISSPSSCELHAIAGTCPTVGERPSSKTTRGVPAARGKSWGAALKDGRWIGENVQGQL